MRKYLLILILMIIILFDLNVPLRNGVTIEWTFTYGGATSDGARSLIQTSDGGFALAGYTYSYGVGQSDFWLVKTNSFGEPEWNQTYGGGENDHAYSVVQTSDGGYALTGYTDSYGEGESDFWLVKVNSFGEIEWNQTYGGIKNDFAHSVIQTTDGGFALVGYIRYLTGATSDFCLVKTDKDGEFEWNLTYGGVEGEYAHSAIQTSDRGFVLVGDTYSFGAGRSDCLLVKVDVNGTLEWSKTYGSPDNDEANEVIQSSDGGFVLVGTTYRNIDKFHDCYLVKTNIHGELEWEKTFGGARFETGKSLVQTSDGGFALAGYTFSYGAGKADLWVVKVDITGKFEWERAYGGSRRDFAESIITTSDGGLVVAGVFDLYAPEPEGSEIWFLKLIESDNIAPTSKSTPAWNLLIIIMALMIINVQYRRYRYFNFLT